MCVCEYTGSDGEKTSRLFGGHDISIIILAKTNRKDASRYPLLRVIMKYIEEEQTCSFFFFFQHLFREKR